MGDDANVIVQQPGNTTWVLTSFTWSVSGGELNQQPYARYSGVTNPADKTYTVNIPQGNNQGSCTFYWDQNTGEHTVTITATYTDPANNQTTTAKPVTLTATISSPTVSSFTNKYQAFQFSDQYQRPGIAGGSIGFHQGVDGGTQGNSAIQPGDQFSATVSLPNVGKVGGEFALIQLINVDRAVTDSNGNKYTEKSGGFVLDPYPGNDAGYNDVTVLKYISNTYPSGTQGIAIPEATYGQGTKYSGTIPDGPWLAYQPNSPLNPPKYFQFRLVDSFQTYLVYRAPGGIWVGLSMISWSLSGDVTWNPKQGIWQDTNMNMPVSPAAPGSLSGTNLNGKGNNTFVQWTNSLIPNNPTSPARGNIPAFGVPWIGPKGVNDYPNFG